MSDPYSYDYDEDANPYQTENTNTANMDDVELNDSPSNLPPPPVNSKRQSNQGSSSPTEQKSSTPKAKPAPKKKDAPNTKDLEGFRAKKLFGFAPIGNLPFPIINPNYFTYLKHSGHYIIVPVAFFEFIFIWFVLLENLLAEWLFLGGSVETNVDWPAFIALRLVWAHVIFCLAPLTVFVKYSVIFKACTEQNSILKAPLYLGFVVMAVISICFYIAMWTGGIGAGIFSFVFMGIAGLVRSGGVAWFTVVMSLYHLLVSIGWLILIVCCVVEIGGMLRNYILYRRAKKEAEAAISAV